MVLINPVCKVRRYEIIVFLREFLQATHPTNLAEVLKIGITLKRLEEISMIPLHPEFITKNGKKEFAVIPYEEFEALQELIADIEDLMDLRAAKEEEANKPSVSLAEMKRMLGL